MKHLKRAIPIVLALVMAFALSVSAWAVYASNPWSTTNPPGASVSITGTNSDTVVNEGEDELSEIVGKINTSYAYDSLSSTVTKDTRVGSISVSSGTHTLTEAPVSAHSGWTATAYAPITVSGGSLTVKAETGEITLSGGTLTIIDDGKIHTVIGDTNGTGDLIVSGGTVTAYGTFNSITVEGDGYLSLEDEDDSTSSKINSGRVIVRGAGQLFTDVRRSLNVDTKYPLTVDSTGTGSIFITGGTHTVYTTGSSPVEINTASNGTQYVHSMSGYSNLTVRNGTVVAGGKLGNVVVSGESNVTLKKLGERDGNSSVATEIGKITHSGGTLTIEADNLNTSTDGKIVSNVAGAVNMSGSGNTLTLSGAATVTLSGSGNTVKATAGENTVNVTSTDGGTVNVSGTAQTTVTSTYNTALTVSGGSAQAAVSGQYSSITLNSNGNLVLKESETVTGGTGGVISFNDTGAITATIGENATGNYTVTGSSSANHSLTVKGGTVNALGQFYAVSVAGGKLDLAQTATVATSPIALSGGELVLNGGTYAVYGTGTGNLTVQGSTTLATVYAYGTFGAVQMNNTHTDSTSQDSTLYLGYDGNEHPYQSGRTTVNGGLSVFNGNVVAEGYGDQSYVTITKTVTGTDKIVNVSGGSVTLGNLVKVDGAISGKNGATLYGIYVDANGKLTMTAGSSVNLTNDSTNTALKGIYIANYGETKLTDITVTLAGVSSQDTAIDSQGPLDIKASAGLTNGYAVTTSAPAAPSVVVTTTNGTALHAAGALKISGAYKAARFTSTNGKALEVSNNPGKNLACGEFIGAQASDFNAAIPEKNYYVNTVGNSQTVTDAVWAIQYFMGEATDSTLVGNNQYDAANRVYKLACDIDIPSYSYSDVRFGALYGTDDTNWTITVKGTRTLDLDGYNIIGKDGDGANVIEKDAVLTDLTIVNSGTKSNTVAAGTTGSSITASTKSSAILFDHDGAGKVTVNATTADITIAGGTDSTYGKPGIAANGNVTINNSAAAKVVVSGKSAIEADGDLFVTNGKASYEEDDPVYTGSGTITFNGGVSTKSVVIFNYSSNEAAVTTDAITATGSAVTDYGVSISNFADGMVTTGAIESQTNVIVMNIGNGNITAEASGTGSDPVTTISATGDVTVWNFGEGTVSVAATGVTSGTKTAIGAGGDVDIWNRDTGLISVDGVTTASNGKVRVLNAFVESQSSESSDYLPNAGTIKIGNITGKTEVEIANFSFGAEAHSYKAITTGNVTASDGKVSIYNMSEGEVVTGAVATENSGDVMITNQASGTITTTTVNAKGKATILNATVTYGETPEDTTYGDNKGKIVTTTVSGDSVEIANYSTYYKQADEYALTTGGVTANGTTDGVKVTNAANGKVKVASITSNNAAAVAPVTINNSANGTVEVTGAIDADDGTTDGDVTIINGTVTPPATEDGNPTYTNGKVKTGAITGKIVKIENNSTSATNENAVETGNITATGNVELDNFAAGTIKTGTVGASTDDVSVFNWNDGDVVTGNIQTQDANGKGNVQIANFGAGTIGASAVTITATGDVRIWNGALKPNQSAEIDESDTIEQILDKMFLPDANKGKIVFGAISGKNVEIDNYGKPNEGNAVETGAITGTGAAAAQNGASVIITNESDGKVLVASVTTNNATAAPVTINNNANGTVEVTGEIKADGTTDGDVTIINGKSSENTGSVTVGSKITGAKLTITNNAKKDDSDATKGKIAVNGAITATVASGESKITNNASGAINIEPATGNAITTFGVGLLTIDNKSDGSVTIKSTALSTSAVTAKNGGVALVNSGSGKVEIQGTSNGIRTYEAAGAVTVTNSGDGNIEITGSNAWGIYAEKAAVNVRNSGAHDVTITGKSAGIQSDVTVDVTNSGNGTVMIQGTTAINATGALTLTNGTEAVVDDPATTDVDETAAMSGTGSITVTGAVKSAKLDIVNYASVKTEDDTIVPGTGTITVTGAITATGAVQIDNNATGTVDTKAISTTGANKTDAAGENGKNVAINNNAGGTVNVGAITTDGGNSTYANAAGNGGNAGTVSIDNKANGIVTTGAISAAGGEKESTTGTSNGANGNVTLTNGAAATKPDSSFVYNNGKITVSGAVTGAAIDVNNFSNNADAVSITGNVTGSGNVTIDNGEGDTADAKYTGAVKITGTITTTTSGDVTITNNGTTTADTTVTPPIVTIGKITVGDAITAAGKVEVMNNKSGLIETSAISASDVDNGAKIVNGTSDAATPYNGAITVNSTISSAKLTVTNNAAVATGAPTDKSGRIDIKGAVTATGNTTIDNTADGVIDITVATGDAVSVSSGDLTIGNGEKDGTITITAAAGDGVKFTSADGNLTIKAGTIIGKGTGKYGLNVGAGTGTVTLFYENAGNVISATYSSVYTGRTNVYTNLLGNSHDWANNEGILPRTKANYETNKQVVGAANNETAIYKVVAVKSHSLTVNPTSGSLTTDNQTTTPTLKLVVNGTSYDDPYISSAASSSDDVATAATATGTITKHGANSTTATITFKSNAYGTDDEATFTVNPTPTYTPSSVAPAPAPTASLSGDDNSVSIGVSTGNGVATMSEPKAADLEKVIGAGVETGEVVINMSSLNSSIDTATVPTKTFDAIEVAVTDASNDAEKLTIKLPASSVTFNAAALDAIADQATGSSISLEVSKEAASTLTTAQRDAVKDLDVQDVYSITLTSGSKTISDFNGGSATVTVDYTLKAGQSARGIVVWYVANDGTLTEVPATFSAGKVTFTVSHFSNYVIAYDAERAAACPQDSTCPIAAFSDADAKAWYHDGVHWALENGAMSGMGDGTFAPNGTTTRAMVAQILWNLEGKPAYVGMSEYTDVDNEAWYGPAIRWASAEGIVTGYDGKFAPNDPVTREQLATMLYRYAQYKNIDVSVGEDTNILSYEDAFNVNTWAMAAMQWACGAGVMNGAEVNGTIYLQPQNNATRAVVATMIARFCTEVAK